MIKNRNVCMTNSNEHECRLLRRSALQGLVVPGKYANITNKGPGIKINEQHPLSITQVEIGSKCLPPFLKLAENFFNLPMPIKPNTSFSFDSTRVIWTGPNRWLFVEPEVRDLSTILKSELNEINPAIIDLSHARSCIQLSGNKIREVLMKGAAIDWHPESFLKNQCAQTKFFNLPALIDCKENDSFDVFVARGFAQNLWGWIKESAEEFGYEVV
jgi:heterotetrameric sarcosine oxidase gamma subunit